MDAKLREIKDEMLKSNTFLMHNQINDKSTLEEMLKANSNKAIKEKFNLEIKPLADKIVDLKYFNIDNKHYYIVDSYVEHPNGTVTFKMTRITIAKDTAKLGNVQKIYVEKHNTTIIDKEGLNKLISNAVHENEINELLNKISAVLVFKNSICLKTLKNIEEKCVDKFKTVKYLGKFKYRICKYTEKLTKEEYDKLVDQIDEATKKDALDYIEELKKKYKEKYVIENKRFNDKENDMSFDALYVDDIKLDYYGRIYFVITKLFSVSNEKISREDEFNLNFNLDGISYVFTENETKTMNSLIDKIVY